MNFTCGGGSSSVFSSALKECCDSMWTSSMMKILKRLLIGRGATVSMRSRILATWVCDAPSISSTSKALPSAISRQFEQALHGSGVGPCSQLSAFARSRAVVVFPTLHGPRHVVLADDLVEALRSQPPSEHLVRHRFGGSPSGGRR